MRRVIVVGAVCVALAALSGCGNSNDGGGLKLSGVGNDVVLSVLRLTADSTGCDVAIEVANNGSERISQAYLKFQYYDEAGQSLSDGIAGYTNIMPGKSAVVDARAPNTHCDLIKKIGNMNTGFAELNYTVSAQTILPIE